MESSQSWIANVEILNSLLRKESWFNTFWAKFSGNVDISRTITAMLFIALQEIPLKF
jgi:hypothetical protein